jgi:hypothetical protein
MAQLYTPIDTSGIDPNATGFSQIPEGWYQVLIADTDENENSKGNGRFIKVEYLIASGALSGEKVLQWINYQHSTPKAQEIGLRQLAKLMQCVNVPSPLRDTMILHSKKLEIYIKPDGSYNTVDDMRPYSSAGQQRPVPQQAPQFPDDDIAF